MFGFISKNSLLYLLFGLFFYCLFLIATFPAQLVISNLLPGKVSSIAKFNNVAGSIWQGQAVGLDVKQVSLGNVSWELSALPLILGKLNAHLNAKRNGVLLITDATLSSGHIGLQNTRIEFPVSDLMPLLYGYPVSLAGDLKAHFKNVVIEPETQLLMEGRAVLSDVQLVAPQSLSLGSFVLKFEKQKQGTRISINDQQGPLQVDALVTLAATGFYTVNATLVPQSFADEAIKNSLLMLGRADNQGRYTVSTKGRIPLKF
jgi:hypothetical protein